MAAPPPPPAPPPVAEGRATRRVTHGASRRPQAPPPRQMQQVRRQPRRQRRRSSASAACQLTSSWSSCAGSIMPSAAYRRPAVASRSAGAIGTYRCRKRPPSPLNPLPSTLYPLLSTVNHQPSTLNPQPSTLNPHPQPSPGHPADGGGAPAVPRAAREGAARHRGRAPCGVARQVPEAHRGAFSPPLAARVALGAAKEGMEGCVAEAGSEGGAA